MNLSEWIFRVELEKYDMKEEMKGKLMKLKGHLIIELQERLICDHEGILDVREEKFCRYEALASYAEHAELLIQIENMSMDELKDFCISDSNELMNILNNSKYIV